MYCPNCRTEYREGITVCADCGAALVAELPLKPVEMPELVTVFETRDISLLLLAKSMLDEAGIEYVAKGELPLEQLSVGEVEIQVDRQDKEMAADLLHGLTESTALENDLEGEDGTADEGGGHDEKPEGER